MGYTPYKMVGHTLKGIKQNPAAVAKMKAFGTKDSDMPDGVSQKSGVLYKGGVGSSPAKGFFSNLGKKISGGAKKFMKGEGALGLLNPLGRGISELKKAKEKKAQAAQDAAASAGAAGDLEGRVAALEAGSGGGGGDAAATAMSAGGDPLLGGVGPDGLPMASGGPMATAMKPKRGSSFAGIGDSVGAVTAMSDIRLKEKIEKAGKSPSGIPIYMFNYIGENKRYEGAMAQDLISMGIDAVKTHESGYYMVDYSKIDVDMKLIN